MAMESGQPTVGVPAIGKRPLVTEFLLRVCVSVITVIGLSLIASNKNFDTQPAFNYLLATTILAFLYSAAQSVINVYHLAACGPSLLASAAYIYFSIAADLDKAAFLNGFSDCFSNSLPDELSPERSEDHRIDVVPGSSPPNKPPYRVSAAQQNEILSQSGVRMDLAKVKAIKSWRDLKTVHDIRNFLGLCSYHRRFIRHFAEIDSPLHALTHKGITFKWPTKEITAFNKHLKEKSTSDLVIILPNLLKPLVEYAYNITVHTSTGKAPFEIVERGKKVPPILQTKDKIFEADKYVQNTDGAYRKIKLAPEKTRSKQKKATDCHHRELVFSLGDWILLRFEKARLRKMKGKECLFPKLGMRYYRPFQECDKISDVAYGLKLPKGSKIHNAFLVSLLRPFVGYVPKDMVP
ncbi:hypothetical protein L7F22_067401 [Adiantum nelumboides]|nr:hypothetical protein [Adiantum nelumboides]